MVFLNIDLGELPDEPEALYALAQLANVACGGHAGDEASMRQAIALCRRYATRLGAHPSYPDREGFGRRRSAMAHDALRDCISDQCARLAAIASDLGQRVDYVKAHGALYHAAREDQDVAEALVSGATAALGLDVTFIGPAQGALAALTTQKAIPLAREGFADRATRPDGTLVPRGEAGAVLTDPQAAAHRARVLAASGEVETICVHGDTPGAVAIATAVRRALSEA